MARLMGGEQKASAFVAPRVQPFERVQWMAVVHASGRLVKQQKRSVLRLRAGNEGLLARSSGQLGAAARRGRERAHPLKATQRRRHA